MSNKCCTPLLEIEKIIPILNRITIFGGLTDNQLYSVFKLLEKTSYKMGEFIFKQGDEPTHIYVVMSGRVKIVFEAEGTPLEIIEFGVGQCLGETSVIAIMPHSASALVTQDAELIVLSRAALLSLFESDKELFGRLILNIAREACRRLHNTDEILLHYFSKEKK
jgi:CRP-like cAMP-binding protein